MMKARRIGTLVRALMMGTIATTGAIATGTVLVGCADEQAPETHVARLSDAAKRTAAVERLIQMFNDKMTTDQQNREGKTVKPLLDVIVQPLADLAEKADLDTKTQGQLLAMLADTRDKRAMIALVKAVDSYKMDDKRPEAFDTNMNDVVRNLGEMKAMEASDALFKLFQSTHASWPKAQNKTFYRTLQDTMIAINDPKWEDGLIKLIEAPIKTGNAKEHKANDDQAYWQTVSALLLGNIKSQKAVPSLIKVVLSPFKGGGSLGVTSMSALIKIGKPSIDAGVDLLTGKNTELAKYAEEESLRFLEDKGEKIDDTKKADAKKVYIDHAVIIVSNIGRAECVGPMLAQIEAGDDTTDAVIARELYRLPKDPKINDAFKKVWAATKADARMVGGLLTKPVLTGYAAEFADLDIATAVATGALEGSGDAAAGADVQEAALVMLLKVGGPAQLELIEKLAAKERDGSKLGKGYEKEIKVATDMIKECGDKADCYVGKLATPDAQKDSGFAGIKAAYTAAALGGEQVRGALVEQRMKTSNAAVANAIDSMIDRLTPSGDKEVADKLEEFVNKALNSRDEQRARSVTNLNTVVNRLRARGQ